MTVSIVSSICSKRPIPNVVTFSTWVSPLKNKDEPWTVGNNPISAEISLISVGDLPSNLSPPDITLSLTTFFTNDLKANLIAFVLSSSSLIYFSTTCSSNSDCLLLLSFLSVIEVIFSTSDL